MKAEFLLCDFDYEALDFSVHAPGALAERCMYFNATLPRVGRHRRFTSRRIRRASRC